MRCVEDLDAYVRDSLDAYYIGRTFVAFHAGSLFGVVTWGRPDGEDAREICAARGAELVDPGPHYVLMDYRRIDSVDPEAFQTLADFLNANRDVLSRATARTALVVPNLVFAGATVAGFYNVVKSPYESKVFMTLAEAEAWLDVPVVGPVTLVEGASAAGRTTTAAVIALLAKTPGLSLEEAAAALGTSSRTLQRKLQSEHTNYAVEARRALVRRAKHLLTTTELKIADVAEELGGMTPQHFSEMFRAETGMTPASYRAQTKKA